MILGSIAERFGRMPTYNVFSNSTVIQHQDGGADNMVPPTRNALTIGDLVDSRPLEQNNLKKDPIEKVDYIPETQEEDIKAIRVTRVRNGDSSEPNTDVNRNDNQIKPSRRSKGVQHEKRAQHPLALEIQSDSSNRPYACSMIGCPWTFKRKSDLRRHMKKHERPKYECPYHSNNPLNTHKGGSTFTRLDVLKRHLKSIHFVPDLSNTDTVGRCKACSAPFKSIKDFTEHCEDCSKTITHVMTPESSEEPDN